jgi:hypothetical protein
VQECGVAIDALNVCSLLACRIYLDALIIQSPTRSFVRACMRAFKT